MAERVRDLDDSELFNSLDWNRSVVVRKLDGLTFDQTTAVVTPTGVALLGIVTLRWILLHMIRETARHAGHLDILRELTDGRTGDE